MRRLVTLTCAVTLSLVVFGHDRAATRAIAQSNPNVVVNPNTYQDLRWRSVGPFRAARCGAWRRSTLPLVRQQHRRSSCSLTSR